MIFRTIPRNKRQCYSGGLSSISSRQQTDERFIVEPNTIKSTYHKNKKDGGYYRYTKIGPDGLGIIQRYITDHDRPQSHTEPHDHIINWSNVYLDQRSQLTI